MSAWFFAASSPATIGALRPHRDVLRLSPPAEFDWRPVTGRDRAALSAERLLSVHETLAGPTITITGTYPTIASPLRMSTLVIAARTEQVRLDQLDERPRLR